MVKFGTLLNSRPAAKEAFLRMVQMINGAGASEGIVLDLSGVEILTPSYADELLHNLRDKYGSEKITIESTETEAVRATLKALKDGSVQQAGT